ncbi:elongator complex protein 6-like [Leptopilina boulardi]|uniref:elongator complex protein 6-like n=1 Tax=Leptopilina boulardi TaxID=63433 RepID=UPI0021F5030A|nr:elongator complex protein 6-like [Leptopilina boulardi]
MTDAVCSALGIDRVDLRGKLTLIEEQHGSDANFLVNSFISSSLEKGQGICLVLFHNTFGHYHNIGMKLGYNLNVLRERGQVSILEPMKLIANNIHDLGHDSVDAANVEFNEKNTEDDISNLNIMEHGPSLVHKLIVPLKKQIYELLKNQDSVMVIIDDLSHLFDLQMNLRDVWFFVRYIRTFVEFEHSLSMCILTHTYKADPDSCQPDLIAVGLKHIAQLIIVVEPLSTGLAKDVSGKMNVRWKMDSIRTKYNWPEKLSYLFKLLDRQVKVFPPGSSTILF